MPYILSVFDEDISSLIQNYIIETSEGKVKIITDDIVSEFVGENEVKGIFTTRGSGFETEMVVICAGVKPVVDIAEEAGIALGITGAIKVNSRMETSISDIYACGDCTEKINIIYSGVTSKRTVTVFLIFLDINIIFLKSGSFPSLLQFY